MKLNAAIIASAALAATLSVAMPAKAGVEIDYSTDGTTYNTLATAASGGMAVYTGGTLDGLTVSLLDASSNSPGTSSLSKVVSTNLDLTNSTGSAITIYFKFGDTGFTSPSAPPPLSLDSHTGGTVLVGSGSDILNFTSYVDPGNGQNTTSGGGIISSGTGSPSITGAGSFSNDQTATITSLGTPYSMTELLSVTLGAGADINFADSTTLTPIPEPATLGLVGLGLAGLGFVRRRRRA